jgi:hypothetical protein
MMPEMFMIEKTPQSENMPSQLAPSGSFPVAEIRTDHLIAARFDGSMIELRFADNKTFRLEMERLEMPLEQFDWRSVSAASTGDKMVVLGVDGEVPVDAATLRYLVDAEYAAKADESIANLHMSPAEQDEACRLSQATRDPRWNDVGDEDDLLG